MKGNPGLLILMVLLSCSDVSTERAALLEIDRNNFEQQLYGQDVGLFQLKGDSIEVLITNYGGRIVALYVPDRSGVSRDVVLGFPTLDGYLNANEVYHGALIGRFANRIRNGRFALDSIEYQLAINNPPNSLHGGPKGFHNVVWNIDSVNSQLLRLSYSSPHMEEGFPGRVNVNVTYRIVEGNGLEIKYHASTDRKTIINLTSHPFFNLDGEGAGEIENHFLKISASRYSPVDSTLIPQLSSDSVEGTPFDFRQFRQIKEGLAQSNEQLDLGGGYDHNYILDKGLSSITLSVAEVFSKESGIKMTVSTTEPGLQFYGGNFLNGSDSGKSGPYRYREAFCLETQHFPDSPNRPDYPSTVLEPGEKFESVTRYNFTINQ